MKKTSVKLTGYLFFGFIITVMLLLVAEIVLRFVPKVNREWMDYNKVTVWRMKANNVSTKWTYEHPEFTQSINRDGFNDANHDIHKKAGVKRIMIIGDSYTAGLDYPINETFCGVLQQKLNEKYAGKYEVMNCGVPAWGTEQEYLYFVNEGKKYKPDYVLLVMVPNDIRESYTRHLIKTENDTLQPWANYPMTKFEKLMWILAARSSLVAALVKIHWLPNITNESMFWKYFAHSFPDFPPFKEWDTPLFLKEEPWQVKEANRYETTLLSSLNSHCREINSDLLLTVIPTREEFDSTFTDSTKYLPGKVSFWLDSVSTGLTIPYLNTYPAAKQLEKPLELYQNWEFHFDPDGHRFMGEQLFSFMEERVIKAGELHGQ